MKNFLDFSVLDAMKNHPVSGQIDRLFKTVIKEEKKMPKESAALSLDTPAEHNDQELSLSDDGELDLNLGGEDNPPQDFPQDDGFELSLDSDSELDLAEGEVADTESQDDHYGELSLDGGESDDFSLNTLDDSELSDAPLENLGELDLTGDLPPDDGLSLSDDDSEGVSLDLGGADEMDLSASDGLDLVGDESLSLSDDIPSADLNLGDDEPLGDGDLSLSFGSDDAMTLSDEAELSDDAKEKLKEIDAIMDLDASQVGIKPEFSLSQSDDEDENLDEPLVSPDLNLESLNFSNEETEEEMIH